MKRFILFVCLAAYTMPVWAQNVPYHVVFDLTSKDTADYKTMIRWINGITASNPEARLEVVLYGQSLPMVTKGQSVVENDLAAIIKNNNITFKVCEAAMQRYNIAKSQLLPGIDTVPDGIYQLVTRQKEGWGYIKVAR